MRWLDNGDKKAIGVMVFLTLLILGLLVTFCCCSHEVPINIKTNPPTTHNYDDFEVKANYDSKKDKDFIIEMEEYASRQPWKHYEIRPYYATRIGSKHIRGVIIYFWK